MTEPFDCACNRIRAMIARSEVAEDPAHADNTLAWLLRLEPAADQALQLAALAHDIERATRDRYRREAFDDYDAFKAAHARRGARLLRRLIQPCGLPPATLDEACRLVERHETGGDPRSDLLREADSLSYFDVNLPLYYAREGWDETLRRAIWGLGRLGRRGRDAMRGLRYQNPILQRLVDTALQSVAPVS